MLPESPNVLLCISSCINKPRILHKIVNKTLSPHLFINLDFPLSRTVPDIFPGLLKKEFRNLHRGLLINSTADFIPLRELCSQRCKMHLSSCKICVQILYTSTFINPVLILGHVLSTAPNPLA